VLVALLGYGTTRIAHALAVAEQPKQGIDEPYAPAPANAPIVFLGYREAAADVLWIRMLGYWGGEANANGIAGLVDAIVALDPQFHRIYVTGSHAMTIADHGVTQDTYLHALRVLERGHEEFPDDYKILELTAQIYTGDLKTTDPAQRREWDEKGLKAMESALHKPNAPTYAATWAATMRSKLGQKQRAIRDLREMILLTRDLESRKRMIEKLAALEEHDSAEVASEMYAEKRKFEGAWQRERPTLPPTMYVLLGPPPPPGFDMTDLATGGRDLLGATEPTTSEDDPSSP